MSWVGNAFKHFKQCHVPGRKLKTTMEAFQGVQKQCLPILRITPLEWLCNLTIKCIITKYGLILTLQYMSGFNWPNIYYVYIVLTRQRILIGYIYFYIYFNKRDWLQMFYYLPVQHFPSASRQFDCFSSVVRKQATLVPRSFWETQTFYL